MVRKMKKKCKDDTAGRQEEKEQWKKEIIQGKRLRRLEGSEHNNREKKLLAGWKYNIVQ